MLYQRWRQVANLRSDELALWDLADGRRWTFAQLAAASDNAAAPPGAVTFPQGAGADFILDVLRAWRFGRVVCPLEIHQRPPQFPAPTPGVIHLKITSATTGPARLVAFSDGQLCADAANIVATMGLRPDWPNLGVISLAHSYGFSNLVLPLLLHGIPLVLAPAPLPETLRSALDTLPAWTLPAVPALWRAWRDAGLDLSRVRLAISAGAPLPVELEAAVFTRHQLKIHNFYGSSECGGIAYDETLEPRGDPACVGAPMANVAVAVGESGCLEVRGPAVATGYWPEPGDALRDGCFHTSDLAVVRDGRVYLTGRAGDRIHVAGRKISPEEIERALLAHPSVADCLVFGVPANDSSREDTIVACVEPAISARATTDFAENEQAGLRRFLLENLPAWQVPRDFWIVDSLQTNARGKRSRADWRQRYLADRTRRNQ